MGDNLFMKKFISIAVTFFCFVSLNLHAVSQDGSKEKIKVGVLKWGTANWELNTLKGQKLDQKDMTTLSF